MIVFNLSCDNFHHFEGWFESSAVFEQQRSSHLLSCPLCGTNEVTRELHAPYVNTGAVRAASSRQPAGTATTAKESPLHGAVSQLIDHVIANTENVADAFAEEARKIHYNEVAERAIRGSATPDEVTELQEEGIEVFSLPLPPSRRGNPH